MFERDPLNMKDFMPQNVTFCLLGEKGKLTDLLKQ